MPGIKGSSIVNVLIFCMNLQIIWNSSTRGELLKFVDKQRVSQCQDGSYDMKEAHSFKYTSLSKELHVGEVYLRVYNEQPDYELSQPELFCDSLLEFIWKLVDERKRINLAKMQAELEPVQESEVSSETSSDSETGDEFSEVELAKKDAHSKLVDEKRSYEETVLRDLTAGLTALQVH